MRWCVIALSCALFPLAQPARAVIKVWVGTNGNWTTSVNWSPSGAPLHGDDVFLTSGDATNRTVTFNDTSQFLRVYRSVRVDSTGGGLMTLQQQDPNTTINADFLYVGNAQRGTYDVFGGGGFFGATEVHAQGVLSFRSGTVFRSASLLQAGGTVDAVGSFTVTGSYTFNGGSASGHVTAGTFLSNGGAYGGGVTALSRLVLGGNGNGTFGGSVVNHGPLTLPAGRTFATDESFGHVGATFIQLGNVSVGTQSSVNGGASWLHQAGSHVNDGLSIARGGNGTYSIGPGATLTADSFDIALGGDGTFTQTGGVAALGSGLIRGGVPGPPGRMYWNMSGGTMTHSGFFVVGTKDATSGTFIQSGGFARVRSLVVNVDATTSASVNLSGGTFIVDMGSVSHGTINVTGGSASFLEPLDGSGAVNVSGTGALAARRLRQFSLSVGGDAVVNLDPPSLVPGFTIPTHRVRTLALEQQGSAVRGRVDLGGGRLVVDYAGASPAQAVRQYLVSGYAGGAWTGTGLQSGAAALNPGRQTALGYAESADVLGPAGGLFAGFAVDETAILVRYTRYGDANIDGIVSLADFNRLASNFGGTNKVWAEGDFNYDGLVNLTDFNRLASNFGLSAAGPDVTPDDWAALAAAVPEPASCAVPIGGVAASAATCRRPRRRIA
jgi:hypothetical protein